MQYVVVKKTESLNASINILTPPPFPSAWINRRVIISLFKSRPSLNFLMVMANNKLLMNPLKTDNSLDIIFNFVNFLQVLCQLKLK